MRGRIDKNWMAVVRGDLSYGMLGEGSAESRGLMNSENDFALQ